MTSTESPLTQNAASNKKERFQGSESALFYLAFFTPLPVMRKPVYLLCQ